MSPRYSTILFHFIRSLTHPTPLVPGRASGSLFCPMHSVNQNSRRCDPCLFTQCNALISARWPILDVRLVDIYGCVLSRSRYFTKDSHHGAFDLTHCFCGWTVTSLVSCQVRAMMSVIGSGEFTDVPNQVILLTNDYRPQNQSLGQVLANSPAFWLIATMCL